MISVAKPTSRASVASAERPVLTGNIALGRRQTRQAAIAVAQIVQMLAKPQDVFRRADGDQCRMKGSVLGLPCFVGNPFRTAAKIDGTAAKPMRGGQDLRLPIAVSGGDGETQRQRLDPDARLGQAKQVLDRDPRNAEAALTLQRHQSHAAEPRQSLAQRAHPNTVCVTQCIEPQAVARPQPAFQDVLAQTQEQAVRNGLRRLPCSSIPIS